MDNGINGITIPVEIAIKVWGRKVDYIQACVDDEAKADDDSFWNEEFTPHLKNAIKLLGDSSKYESLITAVATQDSEMTLDYLSALTISFVGGRVYYDYIFESGELIGNFDVHLRGTPDGKLEFVEMT